MKKPFVFYLGNPFSYLLWVFDFEVFIHKFGDESRRYTSVANIWRLVLKSCKPEMQVQQGKIQRVQDLSTGKNKTRMMRLVNYLVLYFAAQ